jgi:diguanylate cyclase (GGDEF)-like protein/PAS domain S-box-containing protein
MLPDDRRTDRKRNLTLAACAVFLLADLAFGREPSFEAPFAVAAFLPCSLLFISVAAYRFQVAGGICAALAVGCLVATFGEHVDPATVAMETIVGAAIGHIRASSLLRDRRFLALTDNATELVLVIDRRGSATYASPSFAALLGCEPSGLAGSGYRKIFDARSGALIAAAIERALAGTAAPQRFELEAEHADGSSHVLDVTATNRLTDPAVRGVILNGRDISERRFVEAQLAKQASHDSLTGLPNRNMLHARLDDALTQSTRDTTRVALLVIDLDRFKDVNDALGHHAGDALLCEVASRLKRQIRDADFAARLGGDEFAIVISGADIDDATVVAERLVTALGRPYDLRSQAIAISASVGIALGESDSTVAGLLRQADIAMYAAKRRRSGIAIFTRNDDDRALDRLTMASTLPSAIANDELVLHYQPQINVATGEVAGVEALVRWQHPERGLLYPDVFLPLAEEIGMMDRLTDWVLRVAIRQVKRWNREGSYLRVAVNLSAQDLRDGRISESIARLIALYGIDPRQLCLELTETTVTTEADRAAEALRALSRLGIRISIDDFGTGYSSLSHLKQFPVDELKIDKQFVIGMATDPDDAAIVSSTIELAHRLGVDVVVEGVEDRAAYDAVAQLGAEYAQGFGISHPLTAKAFETWLKEYEARRGSDAATA